jgi:hypothetical protein
MWQVSRCTEFRRGGIFEHARAAGRLRKPPAIGTWRVRANLEDWRRLLRNQAKLRVKFQWLGGRIQTFATKLGDTSATRRY